MSQVGCGARIIGSDCRAGIVTEVREDGALIFAKPDTVDAIIKDHDGKLGLPRGAQVITATAWRQLEDGSYSGKWFDSRLDASLTVQVVSGA